MFKRIPLLLLILLGLHLFPTKSLFAQTDDLPQTHTFDSGTTFDYPEGWSLQAESNFALLLNGEQLVIVADYPLLDFVSPLGADLETRAVSYLRTLYAEGIVVEEGTAESTTIDNRSALLWMFAVPDGGNLQMLIIQFTNGQSGLLISLAGIDVEDGARIDLTAVAETFDNVSDEPAENCGIITKGSGSVALRVGPGDDRAIVSYFQTDQPVAVVSTTTDESGDAWLQLDKDEVVPDSTAAEVWINATDSQPVTDCLDVTVDAETPLTTDNALPTGNAPTTDGVIEPAIDLPPDSIIPAEGDWTVTFDLMIASCVEDTEPMRATRSREPVQVSVQIIDGGAALEVGEAQLDWFDLNAYEGWTDFEFDGQILPTRFFLRVESETLMVGSIGINFRDNLCSAQLPLIMRK